MNTCKVIVKHGVSLVTGASTSNSNSSSACHGNIGTMANAHRLAPLCSSSSSSSSSQAEFFSVRALAHSFPHLCVRQAPSQQLQQWRSLGQSQALQYNNLGGPFLVSFKRSVRNGDGSTTIVASSQNGGEKDVAVVAQQQEEDGGPKFDVSSNCVTPVFRFSPFIQQPSDLENTKLRILFLSEGNVCRSVYAEAIFNSLIEEHGMQEFVECSSKGSRDYNIGERPDPRALQVAEEVGLKLPDGVARVFDCHSDIVLSDLLVVMDKFNASDVLKEVTVYEAVDKEAQYCYKVRRLSEFCRTKVIEDIDDPLYGNMGGPEELDLLREAYEDIRDSCVGLMQTILDVKANLQGSETIKQGIAKSLGEMESLDWLVPPMLQKADSILAERNLEQF